MCLGTKTTTKKKLILVPFLYTRPFIMSHARRHEKKEWFKSLQKLFNPGTTKNQREKVMKKLEKHEKLFHEYAEKWNNDEQHKSIRRKYIQEHETLVMCFRELWLLFAKYINQGVLMKVGYYSLKMHILYAMIPMRGEEIEKIEKHCIDADWDVDSRVFGDIDYDTFKDLMYDSLESWIDMDNDPLYACAFTLTLLLSIANMSHHPPTLFPLRAVHCISNMKEMEILNKYWHNKELLQEMRLRFLADTESELLREQRWRGRRHGIVYRTKGDLDVVKLAIADIENDCEYSDDSSIEEEPGDLPVFHKRRSIIRKKIINVIGDDGVEREIEVDEEVFIESDDEDGERSEYGDGNDDSSCRSASTVASRMKSLLYSMGGDENFSMVHLQALMSSRLPSDTKNAGKITAKVGPIAFSKESLLNLAMPQRSPPPKEEQQFNKNSLKGHGRWLQGHGWMVPKEHVEDIPSLKDLASSIKNEKSSDTWDSAEKRSDPWIYVGSGADRDPEVAKKVQERENSIVDVFNRILYELIREVAEECLYSFKVAIKPLVPIPELVKQLGMRLSNTHETVLPKVLSGAELGNTHLRLYPPTIHERYRPTTVGFNDNLRLSVESSIEFTVDSSNKQRHVVKDSTAQLMRQVSTSDDSQVTKLEFEVRGQGRILYAVKRQRPSRKIQFLKESMIPLWEMGEDDHENVSQFPLFPVNEKLDKRPNGYNSPVPLMHPGRTRSHSPLTHTMIPFWPGELATRSKVLALKIENKSKIINKSKTTLAFGKSFDGGSLLHGSLSKDSKAGMSVKISGDSNSKSCFKSPHSSIAAFAIPSQLEVEESNSGGKLAPGDSLEMVSLGAQQFSGVEDRARVGEGVMDDDLDEFVNPNPETDTAPQSQIHSLSVHRRGFFNSQDEINLALGGVALEDYSNYRSAVGSPKGSVVHSIQHMPTEERIGEIIRKNIHSPPPSPTYSFMGVDKDGGGWGGKAGARPVSAGANMDDKEDCLGGNRKGTKYKPFSADLSVPLGTPATTTLPAQPTMVDILNKKTSVNELPIGLMAQLVAETDDESLVDVLWVPRVNRSNAAVSLNKLRPYSASSALRINPRVNRDSAIHLEAKRALAAEAEAKARATTVDNVRRFSTSHLQIGGEVTRGMGMYGTRPQSAMPLGDSTAAVSAAPPELGAETQAQTQFRLHVPQMKLGRPDSAPSAIWGRNNNTFGSIGSGFFLNENDVRDDSRTNPTKETRAKVLAVRDEHYEEDLHWMARDDDASVSSILLVREQDEKKTYIRANSMFEYPISTVDLVRAQSAQRRSNARSRTSEPRWSHSGDRASGESNASVSASSVTASADGDGDGGGDFPTTYPSVSAGAGVITAAGKTKTPSASQQVLRYGVSLPPHAQGFFYDPFESDNDDDDDDVDSDLGSNSQVLPQIETIEAKNSIDSHFIPTVSPDEHQVSRVSAVSNTIHTVPTVPTVDIAKMDNNGGSTIKKMSSASITSDMGFDLDDIQRRMRENAEIGSSIDHGGEWVMNNAIVDSITDSINYQSSYDHIIPPAHTSRASKPVASFAYMVNARKPNPAIKAPGGPTPTTQRGWDEAHLLRKAGYKDDPPYDVQAYRQAIHRADERKLDLNECGKFAPKWYHGLPWKAPIDVNARSEPLQAGRPKVKSESLAFKGGSGRSVYDKSNLNAMRYVSSVSARNTVTELGATSPIQGIRRPGTAPVPSKKRGMPLKPTQLSYGLT